MLLTKTVKMKWHGSNKKWYKEKGCIFTKIGDKFEVKVEDLQNGSNVYVEIKCDGEDCKNPYLKPIKWADYIRHIKEDGKYYCKKCANILYGSKIQQKTKLLKSISFQKWCYDNLSKEEAIEILSRWDYEKNIDKDGNIIKPDDISFKSHGFNNKGYWFKCPRGLHESELKNISGFIRRQGNELRCNQCNSFGQYLIDTFDDNGIENYWSDKNTINPWEIPSQWNNKVWIKCQNKDYHEDYDVKCSNFLVKGDRCPYCSGHKVHPLDSLGKLLEDKRLLYLWSDKNEKSPYKYAPMSSTKKAWWKCENNKHKDYKRKISDGNRCDFHCPECVRERDESFLQEKVGLYLNELGYTILHEEKCSLTLKNPKTNRLLPFDNEILELNLIIEVHGIQHYKITNYTKMTAKKNGTTPEYELHKRQLYDRYKRIFAKKQGFFFLEIPYWTEKDESYKELIHNKIEEIRK